MGRPVNGSNKLGGAQVTVQRHGVIVAEGSPLVSRTSPAQYAQSILNSPAERNDAKARNKLLAQQRTAEAVGNKKNAARRERKARAILRKWANTHKIGTFDPLWLRIQQFD